MLQAMGLAGQNRVIIQEVQNVHDTQQNIAPLLVSVGPTYASLCCHL